MKMTRDSFPFRLKATLVAFVLLAATLPGFAAQEQGTEPGEPAAPTATAAAKSGGLVVVGKIDGEIGFAESAYVTRLIEAAKLRQAEVLVLELNTFGGRVDAAVAIRDALIEAPQTTVVLIHRRAISAGALISLACTKIAISEGGTIGAATPIVTSPGQEMPQPVEEKYLSYFRQEMRSTAETRGRDPDVAEAMVDAEKEVPGVSEKGKLLTLTTRTALELGIADVEAETVEEALEKLGLEGSIEHLDRSWSEQLVSFLTSPAISSLLFLAMMVLAYLEYQTPGFGAFGFGALACFGLLYFGHYMVNLAGWEELVLFTIGAVLIVLEIFVFPGFGIAGILGILALVASGVLLFMAGDWSDFSFDNPFTARALLQVALSTTLGFLVVLLLVHYLPRSKVTVLGGKLILDQGLQVSSGYSSHEEAVSLVGREGIAATALRPAGKAKIDGQRFNVETPGDFIDAGAAVRVVKHEAGRIVVRRA